MRFGIIGFAALLFLCLPAWGQVCRGLDEIMAVAEGDLLSAGADANSVVAAKPVMVTNVAIGSLTKAYKQTKDEKYSRRLGVVLYGLSRNYKFFAAGASVDRIREAAVEFEGKPGIHMVFLQGYLAVRDAASTKKLSGEIGVDVAKAIEDDLIRSMVDLVVRDAKGGQVSSDSGSYMTEIGLIGRALNEPEYVRIVYGYLSDFHDHNRSKFHAGFDLDMHSVEGVERHQELVGHVNSVLSAIEGYSDPAGYKDKNGLRLDNISLKNFPFIEKMRGVLARYAFPDGRLNMVGDSVEVTVSEPLKQSTNELLAGFGHAVLGGGEGVNQSQVQLHFSGQTGSVAGGRDKDCLSLAWYGQRRQMSGEFGRQSGNLHPLSSSTLTHNTVVVDRQNQNGGDFFGNVTFFASDVKGLSVIQVDGARAYSQPQVKKYRRTIIHNTLDETRPYFVDIFEVEGGSMHDYSIHGSLLEDMIGQCSLEMQPMEGARPLLEDDERSFGPDGLMETVGLSASEYGFISNVDKSIAHSDFNVTFLYKYDKACGTRIHMLADQSMRVFLGSHSVGVPKAFSSVLPPHLIARRSGKKGLKSTFVAVYDMFDGGAKIRSVKRLSSLNAFVAIEIAFDGRVDKLLYCGEGARSMIGGGVQMKGRLGLVCEKDGRLDGYLFGGTLLKKSPMMIRCKKASYSGGILTAAGKGQGEGENYFTVDTILPAGLALRDKWMIVTHPKSAVTHACQIDRIAREGARMVVYLKEDHGLNIEGKTTTELFSPWRVFTGSNRFVIHTSTQGFGR